jgi:hypothetical protein
VVSRYPRKPPLQFSSLRAGLLTLPTGPCTLLPRAARLPQERERPAKPMVGAKGVTSLTSELSLAGCCHLYPNDACL